MLNCPVCTKILKKGACDNTACLYYGHVIYEEKEPLDVLLDKCLTISGRELPDLPINKDAN